jgi:hypothetical protein
MGEYVLVCFEQFTHAGIWAGLMRSTVCWAAAIIGSAGYRYWPEERSKVAIKRAFVRYLARGRWWRRSPRNPEQLGLGGYDRTCGRMCEQGVPGLDASGMQMGRI